MYALTGFVHFAGGTLESIGYGWIASASITGVFRPLLRYAAPRSARKTVGECVSRCVPARSVPRGASAPPYTVIVGSTAFSAWYVRSRSVRYAGAAASVPSEL